VLEVVFDLVAEIMAVFEADAFHAGIREVFHIAVDNFTQCKGRDPAALFAGEVIKINAHLAEKNTKLWMWGDRLIEGNDSGKGT